MLGVYTTPDGRQTMFQTFNENQFMLQSELLRHGELDWLGRDTYFGDQRNYLETNIDDNFLSDDAWSVAGNADTAPHSTDFNPADALREVPADVTAGGNLVQGQQLPHRHAVQRRRQRPRSRTATASSTLLTAAGSTGSGTAGDPLWQRPTSRTPATSAGSTTPGTTPTSMRAARRPTTSRPRSTRTARGAPMRPRQPSNRSASGWTSSTDRAALGY